MPMFATMKPAYKCISTISNKYFTELEDENFWEENYEGDFESINYYYYSDNKERISFLKRENSNCNQFEIKFINGSIECLFATLPLHISN